MARDALDPGPNGDYPYWPRKADGTPDLERMVGSDAMPTGKTVQDGVLIDLTPRHRDGTPIVPPTIPPAP